MEILWHIPWWVYLLALYLVKIGLAATQSRIVPLKKLVITPLIFIFLSVHNLNQPSVTELQLGAWLVAASVGVLAGWWIISRLELDFDKVRFLVRMPGTWSTLIVTALIFASKFYLGYTSSSGGVHSGMSLLALVVSGFSSGIITGRVAGCLYRFTGSKSVSLAG